jgi:hypothetical protein
MGSGLVMRPNDARITVATSEERRKNGTTAAPTEEKSGENEVEEK